MKMSVASIATVNICQSHCSICEERLKDMDNCFRLDATKTMASNTPMTDKVKEILELGQSLDGLICQVCRDIVDQVDFFIQNFFSMKELLRQRFSKNTRKTDIPREERNKRVCLEEIKTEDKVDNEEEDEEEDEDDEEYKELMGVFSRRKVKVEGGLIVEESEVPPGSYRRITSLEYDMFKLRLPPGSMPRVERSPFSELTCVHCQDLFDPWTDKVSHYLSKHMVHPGSCTEAFQCPADGVLLKPEQLREHAVNFHGFRANISWSDIFFTRAEDLLPGDGEKKRSIGSDRYQCTSCGLFCHGLMAFYFHRHCHHSQGSAFPSTCPFCEESTQELSVDRLKKHILRGHIAVKDERKPDKAMSSSSSNKADAEEPMSCENCGLAFLRRCNYNQHTRKCLTGFACRHCRRTFKKGEKALAHFRQFQKDHIRRCKVKSNKKDQKVKNVCTRCDRDFSSGQNLRKHQETACHSTTSNCPKCGDAFKDNRKLVAHMKRCGGDQEGKDEKATSSPESAASEFDPDEELESLSESSQESESEDRNDVSGDVVMDELLLEKE